MVDSCRWKILKVAGPSTRLKAVHNCFSRLIRIPVFRQLFQRTGPPSCRKETCVAELSEMVQSWEIVPPNSISGKRVTTYLQNCLIQEMESYMISCESNSGLPASQLSRKDHSHTSSRRYDPVASREDNFSAIYPPNAERLVLSASNAKTKCPLSAAIIIPPRIIRILLIAS